MKKPGVVGCPCGGAVYASCCGRFHSGAAAPTAELLMRSRYSAYVLGLMDYVHATWVVETRPSPAELKHDSSTKWLGLEVRRHDEDKEQQRATVEFVARYKIDGRAHRLHETSRFVLDDGQWFYLDGSFPDNK